MENDSFQRIGTSQETNVRADDRHSGQIVAQTSDSEITYPSPQLDRPSVVSQGDGRTYSVSIIADQSTEIPYVTPQRAISRIWSALGSSFGESVLHDESSRKPHHCQSKIVPSQEDAGIEEDQYSENAQLLYGARASSVHQRTSQHKCKHRQTSVCSIAEMPVSSPSYNSASGDDGSVSTDSHCHSKIKKGGFDKKARTKLILASILCLLFMTGEMVGGLLAHSLAIISDAAHLLTDFASFMISLMALYLAHRPATKKLSFGWYRIEILGAFVSILMLWVLTGILVYSAVLRIIDDNYEIDASIMLITAATGVAFNIILGTTLHQHSHSHGGHGQSHGGEGGHGHSHGGGGQGHLHEGGDHEDSPHTAAADHHTPKTPHLTSHSNSSIIKNYGSVHDVETGRGSDGAGESADETTPLVCPEQEGHSHHRKPSNINVKAAFIHVLGDLFQSVGVLVAAFIIYYKPEWKVADPICTFLFSLFVLVTTITIMRDILVVLMEGTPRGINFGEVRNTFFQVEGVLDIHNLRVWSLTMDKTALSVHLAVDKRSDPHKVLKMASLAIQKKFNISETTMQIEEYVTEMVDCQDCQGPKL